MNTFEKYPTRWRRFVQVGFVLVLGCLVTSYTMAVHVLRAESAKGSVMMLAEGILWIAILLWGILFLQMMAFLNTKWRAAQHGVCA
jgi:hypothetical protein